MCRPGKCCVAIRSFLGDKLRGRKNATSGISWGAEPEPQTRKVRRTDPESATSRCAAFSVPNFGGEKKRDLRDRLVPAQPRRCEKDLSDWPGTEKSFGKKGPGWSSGRTVSYRSLPFRAARGSRFCGPQKLREIPENVSPGFSQAFLAPAPAAESNSSAG